MATSHTQQQSTFTTRLAASEYSVLHRWLPLWHIIFYGTLVLTTVVLLIGSTYTWWQYVMIFGLSLLSGIWYSLCVIVDPLYWRQHSPVTMAYLLTGWICWFGLILLFPIYLFLLAGLYPQAFIFPRMPWKIVGAVLLMSVSLCGQVLIVGGIDWIFFFTLGGGISAIVLALYIDSIAGQSQKRHRLLCELEATRKELATAERQAGVLEERQRLAREIHDTLAQGFTGIIMQLEAIAGMPLDDTATLHTQLDYIRRIAQTNLSEARRFMWALQPEAFDHTSLADVLTTFATRWSEENSIHVTTTINGHFRSLRPEIEVTLLRAAQEAMTNAQKYAHVCQINVTLSYMDDIVVVDVQDDGEGFDPTILQNAPSDQTTGGFGLQGLRERVEQLGGVFSIESAPGEGTTIAASLPASDNEAYACLPLLENPEETTL